MEGKQVETGGKRWKGWKGKIGWRRSALNSSYVSTVFLIFSLRKTVETGKRLDYFCFSLRFPAVFSTRFYHFCFWQLQLHIPVHGLSSHPAPRGGGEGKVIRVSNWVGDNCDALRLVCNLLPIKWTSVHVVPDGVSYRLCIPWSLMLAYSLIKGKTEWLNIFVVFIELVVLSVQFSSVSFHLSFCNGWDGLGLLSSPSLCLLLCALMIT